MMGCSYSTQLSSPLVELSWIIVSRINPVPNQRARTVVLRGRGLGIGSIECLARLQRSVWNGGGLLGCVVLKSSVRKSEWRAC
jgi:hypothetical protein